MRAAPIHKPARKALASSSDCPVLHRADQIELADLIFCHRQEGADLYQRHRTGRVKAYKTGAHTTDAWKSLCVILCNIHWKAAEWTTIVSMFTTHHKLSY